MAGQDRQSQSAVEAAAAISDSPGAFGLFAALRLLQARARNKTPLGAARSRPATEVVRIDQEPAMRFPPTQLHALRPAADDGPCRLTVHGPGLFGPQGPLPLVLTQFVLDSRKQGDDAFLRFANLFQHRALSLFYRAWADTEPVTALDRPDDGRFTGQVASLVGLGFDSLRGRDALPDDAKLHHAGSLAQSARNPSGLEAMVRDLFGLPARLVEFVGGWLSVPEPLRWRLGSRRGDRLGRGTMAGGRAFDVQHQAELVLGPMSAAAYRRFRPHGPARAPLRALARLYLGDELQLRVRLLLAPPEVPRLRLGHVGLLGCDLWLGARPTATPADDMIFILDRPPASPPPGSMTIANSEDAP